jgi:outer membrane protein
MSTGLADRVALALIAVTSAVSAADLPAPSNLPVTYAEGILLPGSRSASCELGMLSAKLTLPQAVERAMCFDPSARGAWATVKDKAGLLEVSKASYFPSVDASILKGVARNSISSPGAPEFDQNVRYRDPKDTVNFAVTLFDFGLRNASEESAKHALVAALATHNEALRAVILKTTKTWYDLMRADNAAASALESESYLRQLLEVAEGRYLGGAALVTEKLDAASAYENAKFKRIGADGDL